MEKARILIVEDEAIVAMDVRGTLRRLGYPVCGIAASGEQAVEAAAKHRPELVLMDIMLKGEMDGIAAAERIRCRHDIPIVYLTAYADEATLRRAEITQPFGYVLKPFQERELHSNIEMALHRHRAERRLRESERRFRLLYENAPLGYQSLDREARIIEVNRAWCRLFGYGREEVIGTHFAELLPAEGRAAFRERFAAFVRSGEVYNVEYGMVRKNGERVRVAFDGQVAYDENGEFAQTYCICRDVTELRAKDRAMAAALHRQRVLTEQLGRARRQAEEASRAKSRFLANMSHEIRTPLNGIVGFASLLAEDEAGSERVEHAAYLKAAAGALLSLVDDILDISKIEEGKVTVEETEFLLRHTVEDLARMMEPAARGKGLNVATLVHADVPQWVRGDPGRLRQVLGNLVGNAVKFTDEGTITIEVARKGAAGAGGEVEFTVMDTGIGIAEEDRERIFAAFEQANGSRSLNHGGTGLGLAICKELVELMGGAIGVESAAGHGSTFRFTVPFAEVNAEETPGRRSDELPEGLCIRIGGDDRELGDKVAELTRSWRCEVEPACSEPDGLPAPGSTAGGPAELLVVCTNSVDSAMEWAAKLEPCGDGPTRRPGMVVMRGGARGDAAAVRAAGYDAYLCGEITERRLRDTFLAALERADRTGDTPSAPLITRHWVEEHGEKLRILLAEDCVTNQTVTSLMLRRAGLACDVVGDGRAAVEALERSRYDLVLMDCRMPGMDGIEATRTIRAMEREGRRTPIVALTAGALPEDRTECSGAGMNDHIVKPVDLDDLLRVVEKWTWWKRGQENSRGEETVVGRGGTSTEEERSLYRAAAGRCAPEIDRLREAYRNGDLDAIGELARRWRAGQGPLRTLGDRLSAAVAAFDDREIGRVVENLTETRRTNGRE